MAYTWDNHADIYRAGVVEYHDWIYRVRRIVGPNDTVWSSCETHEQTNAPERTPGLPIKDCVGSLNNFVPRRPDLSATDLTAKTIFELLYLNSFWKTIGKICHHVLSAHTPIVHVEAISRFVQFSPRVAPQLLCQHDSILVIWPSPGTLAPDFFENFSVFYSVTTPKSMAKRKQKSKRSQITTESRNISSDEIEDMYLVTKGLLCDYFTSEQVKTTVSAWLFYKGLDGMWTNNQLSWKINLTWWRVQRGIHLWSAVGTACSVSNSAWKSIFCLCVEGNKIVHARIYNCGSIAVSAKMKDKGVGAQNSGVWRDPSISNSAWESSFCLCVEGHLQKPLFSPSQPGSCTWLSPFDHTPVCVLECVCLFMCVWKCVSKVININKVSTTVKTSCTVF